MENPILRLRQFFASGGREVTLPEMTGFYKTLSDEEKAEYKRAIESWDGASEFISSKPLLALPASASEQLSA
jgi:hypothetical protein